MSLQTIAVILCVALGMSGAASAIVGTIREARNKNPGGLILIVLGTVAMGTAGIVISIAAKLLGSH